MSPEFQLRRVIELHLTETSRDCKDKKAQPAFKNGTSTQEHSLALSLYVSLSLSLSVLPKMFSVLLFSILSVIFTTFVNLSNK